jgi:hypothetical protein
MCLSAGSKPGTRVYNEYGTEKESKFTRKNGFTLQMVKIHMKKSAFSLVQSTFQQTVISA